MSELCIDFGGTTIKLGILSNGSVQSSREIPITGTSTDLESAARSAGELVSETGMPAAAIGIALPGVVDRRAGQLVRAHGKYGYLDGVDLSEWARTQLGQTGAVENDARAALIGETAFGCAAGATDAVMVTLGTGIGTAAMVDSRVLRGAHDHAGILGGHVTVDIDAGRCPCGNIGCAEALASTWALGQQLLRHPLRESSVLTDQSTGGSIDIAAVVSAATTDAVARDILDRFVRVWGATIVSLCHAYDPDIVIVSGGVMRARDSLLPRLEAYVHEHLWSSSYRPPLTSPAGPELSVLRGLSVIAKESSTSRSAL